VKSVKPIPATTKVPTVDTSKTAIRCNVWPEKKRKPDYAEIAALIKAIAKLVSAVAVLVGALTLWQLSN
jgi:hypothetical protein